MINLKGSEVGDRFLNGEGNETELIARHGFYYVFAADGRLPSVHLNDGSNCGGRPELNIISKVNPRPWLDDMPDAGIFTDDVKWLSYDEDECVWYAYTAKPEIHDGEEYFTVKHGDYSLLSLVRMPTLTQDQWRDSLISIEELREYQQGKQIPAVTERVRVTEDNRNNIEVGDTINIEQFSADDDYDDKELRKGVDYVVSLSDGLVDCGVRINDCRPYLTQGNAIVWWTKK